MRGAEILLIFGNFDDSLDKIDAKQMVDLFGSVDMVSTGSCQALTFGRGVDLLTVVSLLCVAVIDLINFCGSYEVFTLRICFFRFFREQGDVADLDKCVYLGKILQAVVPFTKW